MIAVDFAGTSVHDALMGIGKLAHTNIDAAGSDISGTVTLKMRAPWRYVLARVTADHGLRVQEQGPTLVRVLAAAAPATELPAFSGRPMTASFHETPIRDAARVFAEAAGVPVTVDPDVTIAVTMRVKNAPWDLALDHVARKYSLDVSRDARGIRISNAKPAPASRAGY